VNPHASTRGEPPQAPGGSVTIHPGAAVVHQDRPAGAVTDRAVDGPAERWRQWNQDHFVAFAAHPQHPVAVLFAEVADVSAGGFGDSQNQQPEHGHERKVARVG
jgi:hypothetical protein